MEKCRYFLADKEYYSTELIEWLTTERISPVIDIRNMWQGDETKQFKDTNIVYNYKGKVYYITDSGKEIELLYKGYDKSRDSQRYGFHPKYEDKRIFRIPLKTDPRIFTKVAWIPSLYLERRKTLQMPCCSSQVKKDLLSMVPVW